MSQNQGQKPPITNRPPGTIINENFTKNSESESSTKKG
jgi:hypothetical protein